MSANIDALSTIAVTCTTAAIYDIGLDGGASGSVAARTMTNGSELVSYQLYTDAARAVVWGDTVGTDTLAAVGTGVTEFFSIFGRVPPQATPQAGTYSDTVQVTVTY